ncbi:hypothetical protein [Vibrio rumoiensis]|uniref:Outer membrane protein beta-barrel domain-containing protein n=1 Tax=Vibrio rumoiensis 1S-45 TaxID=1188252 RepID=A0A1E5DZI1_9VIBR|nr:hypothetical protein [Vibrio rumoiensis]OEF22747.1 hypothetical protein A1QC_03000 [Vibrio rumoiensis 1S-45]
MSKLNLKFTFILGTPLSLSLALLPYSAQAEVVAEKDKLPEDPTKIVTQAGINYSGTVHLMGSVSLGKSNKLNAGINKDGSEWRLGGSWLFDIGIVNFKFGKHQLDHDAEQTNYSVGSFIPLSYFDIEPFGWQMFVMGGVSYNDGDAACEVNKDDCAEVGSDFDDEYALIPTTSFGGYVGVKAMKPLNKDWTLIAATAYSRGSDDYSGYVYGGGAGYHITKNQSLGIHAKIQHNSYGDDQKIGIGYKYQFN